MQKRGGANAPASTPPPPSKNQQNVDASMKSKKVVRKTKTGGTPNAAVTPKPEKPRRKSDQILKKNNNNAKPGGAEDSIRKTKKSAEKKKKKPAKEKDSFEESKRKAKRKSKNIDLKKILMLKEEEEGSDRKKGSGAGAAPGKDKDDSSRRQLQPANVGGPLGKPSSKRKEVDGSDRHVRPAAAGAAHLEHPAASPAGKNNSDKHSDKQQKGSDQKHSDQKPAGDKKHKGSEKLPPPNHPSSPGGSPPPTPPPTAAAAAAPPANEESEEDEEESSANKTPPDKAEPNEGGSDLEPDAAVIAKDKAFDLAAKNETFAVGGVKVNTSDALKGTYGSAKVILKEFDKKIEGYAVGAHLTIKFEKKDVKLRRLFMETEIIKYAQTNSKTGVPQFVDTGDHGNFHCLVIDGLGPSLGEIYDKMSGFSASTTFRIALISLDILRSFHSMLYIHRDIRPHSFYLGKDATNRNKIILGQMGFAKKYGYKKEVEPEEKCDLEIRKPKFKTKVWHPRRKVPFIGAVRFAPRSSHLNKEHTRRDDMESWFYMIYEFLNKSLPWKTVTDKDKILELKESFILDQKFNDEIAKKYGTEITNICEYFGVQNFYEMEPDYNYFELSILNLLKDVNKPGNEKFDWETTPNLFERTGPSQNEDGGKKPPPPTASTTATKP